MRRHGRPLAEPLRGFRLKEALYPEAVGRHARTIGPPVWNKVEGVDRSRQHRKPCLYRDRKLADNRRDTGRLYGDALDRRRGMADYDCRRRQEGPTKRPGQVLQWSKAHCPSTDIDGLSRFYLSVFQRMAIRPQDGATPVELRGLAAGPWLLA